MDNLIRLISSIKIFFKRRIVLISVENFNREFAGKEILSRSLAEAGFLVLIAHKSIIRVLVSCLPLRNQIYIEKGNRYGSYVYLNKAKKNKLFIYSFDEEGLMQTDFDTFLKRNHEKKTIGIIDGIFAWGPNHSNLLRKSGFKEEQILKTGNTRFDHYINILKKQKNKDFSKNEIILICSRFASANPNKQINFDKDKRDGSDEYIEDSKKILSLMILLPKLIREAKIKNKIIVRPHPSESKHIWINACKGLENVSVSCEEPINNVLVRTKFLIHNRCTTAIEASLMNVKVISYEPIFLKSPPNPNKKFINSFATYICKTNDQLIDSLKFDGRNQDLKSNSNSNEYIYNLKQLSSTKIVETLSRKHNYLASSNFFILLMIIVYLPFVVIHHKIFENIYKIFRKKYYLYLTQKNGKINARVFFKKYKKFKKVSLFSKITLFLPN